MQFLMKHCKYVYRGALPDVHTALYEAYMYKTPEFVIHGTTYTKRLWSYEQC